MSFIDLNKIEHVEPFPGYSAKIIHSENMTVTYFDIKKGYPAPEHNHPNEQISTIVSGEFELTIDGKTKLMKPGVVAVIPANVKHSGMPKTDCRIMDVFYPVREDLKKSIDNENYIYDGEEE